MCSESKYFNKYSHSNQKGVLTFGWTFEWSVQHGENHLAKFEMGQIKNIFSVLLKEKNAGI